MCTCAHNHMYPSQKVQYRYRFSAHSLSCICTLYVALCPFCTSTYYNLYVHPGTAPISDCTCTLCKHLGVPQHSASGQSVCTCISACTRTYSCSCTCTHMATHLPVPSMSLPVLVVVLEQVQLYPFCLLRQPIPSPCF